MAELAASALGIIDFTAKLSKFLLECVQDIRGISESLRLSHQTLLALSSSLQQLLDIGNEELLDTEKRALDEVGKFCIACSKVVQSLEKSLPSLDGDPKLKQKAIAAIDMRFNERAIKDKFETINRFTQYINMSLAALSIDVNRISKRVNELTPPKQVYEPALPPLSWPQPAVLGEESEEPGLSTDNIQAWCDSINGVINDPSVVASRPQSLADLRSLSTSSALASTASPSTSSIRLSTNNASLAATPTPPTCNEVSDYVNRIRLGICEKKVRDYAIKGQYLKAAESQKEVVESRERLSSSRPFPFHEEAAMEEKRAGFLLQCHTVERWNDALNIYEYLLRRVKDLPTDQRREREGHLHIKIGSLMAQPRRIGRIPHLDRAARHLKDGIEILWTRGPLIEEVREACWFLVPILRQRGNMNEAEAFERLIDIPEPARSSISISAADSPAVGTSIAPTDTSSTSNSNISGSTIGVNVAPPVSFEWCEQKHLTTCDRNCNIPHCDPYSPKFRFDEPFEDLSLLHHAIREGRDDVVQEMVAEVDLTASDMAPALLLAADSRNKKMAELLLQQGAAINATDARGQNALHRCCSSNIVFGTTNTGRDRKDSIASSRTDISGSSVSLVSYLLEQAPAAAREAFLNKRDSEGRTALFLACEAGDRPAVRTLLEAGADTGTVDTCKRTCLHAAIDGRARGDSRRARLVKRLLEAGADPNACDTTDKTPLFLAAMRGYVEVVDQLLLGGTQGASRIDVDGPAEQGQTPLIAAVKYGKIEIIRKLIKARADPRKRDWNDKDAFAYAERHPHRSLIRNALNGMG
ncbi:ankyrin repeat-containing domain protein [Xylariomycetidae sp. FL2044]|nr:ankyrin repeat-containing domain protein [Xylariomycetidae sp. FL2044]